VVTPSHLISVLISKDIFIAFVFLVLLSLFSVDESLVLLQDILHYANLMVICDYETLKDLDRRKEQQ
jgi:hypothetical protein